MRRLLDSFTSKLFVCLLILFFYITSAYFLPIYAATTPTYEWTRAFGRGTSYSWGSGVAIDSSGNTYVTGGFKGTADFDPGAGTDNRTSSGGSDLFFTKFSSDGTYIWTKTMGGTGDENGKDIVISPTGDIYMVGYFYSAMDFNPEVGVDNHTPIGNDDVFITKFNSDGSYGWTKTMGGTGYDYITAITLDSQNNIYVTGAFENTVDFDPGAGTDNHTVVGGNDIFVTKFNSDGTYSWTKTMGGIYYDTPRSIKVDSLDNVYIAGGFPDTIDFNPGVGVDNHTAMGSTTDIFITKLGSDGSYSWTKTMGGTGNDGAIDILITSQNNIYITGYFKDTVDFDPGAGTDNHTSAGNSDIFLTKLNSDGTYSWTKTMGGTGYDEAYKMTVDSAGNIYTTGYFGGTVDFDPGTGTDSIDAGSAWDDSLFITSLDSAGNYLWTRTSTGGDEADGYGLAISGTALYITGDVYGDVDFNPQGSHDVQGGGDGAAILTKFSLPYLITPSASTTSAQVSSGNSPISMPSAPQCSDDKPGTPTLFQIDMNKNKATLWYTPLYSSVNSYYVRYGTDKNNLSLGVEYNESPSSGVLSYTINDLMPNTTYYFQMRAGNGCMPGDWDGVMMAKTPKGKSIKKYYRF
jgi:hypothetical protein